MPRFRIDHVNRYRYARDIGLNYGEARLLPRDTPGQQVRESRLELDPGADDRRDRLDAWGNRVAWFTLRRPHAGLAVTASSLVERRVTDLPNNSPSWEEVAAHLARPIGEAEEAGADCILARECRLASPFVSPQAAALDYARASFPPERPLLEAVADLAARIHADFRYRPDATRIDTPLAEVLAARHGVCQDFAHLAIAGLRGLGLAARYVSGYLETTPPEGQPRLEGADASHAWIAVYWPHVGWFDFDPTNGGPAGERHLTLAWGRDYGDVPPLKGVIFGAGGHSLEVGVTVSRLAETPDAA